MITKNQIDKFTNELTKAYEENEPKTNKTDNWKEYLKEYREKHREKYRKYQAKYKKLIKFIIYQMYIFAH